MNNPLIFANAPQMRGHGVLAWFGRLMLSLAGWRSVMPANLPERCVIIVYPHTSNWDFPIGLMCKWATGLQGSYLGKDSLFRGPLGWFFRATGGIAVDRRNPTGLVDEMVARFNAPGVTRLAIAPEGTRKYVPAWKSGFHRIALAGNVPIVCATIDYATKRVGAIHMFMPSADIEQDLAALRATFADVRGKRLQEMGVIAWRSEGERP